MFLLPCFVRYDLPAAAQVAVVSFSNDSKVQHPLTSLASTNTRRLLADSIPDKYRLATSFNCDGDLFKDLLLLHIIALPSLIFFVIVMIDDIIIEMPK